MTHTPEQTAALKRDTSNRQEQLGMCDDFTVGYNDGWNDCIDHLAAKGVNFGAVPDDELVLCRKMVHLPEHDGGTAYEYWEPVRGLEPIEGLAEALNHWDAKGNTHIRAIKIFIKAARRYSEMTKGADRGKQDLG